EGAGPSLSRVRTIVEAGIPVMGHVGLTPQSATMLGGFKTQGKTAEKAQRLVDDALALEDAGAFSVVLEAVPAPVAAEVTRRLSVHPGPCRIRRIGRDHFRRSRSAAARRAPT